MVLAGVMLILLATARFAVDTANGFEAFIKHDPRTARIGYLADVTQPLFTTKHSLLVAVLLVGDSFVVRRAVSVFEVSGAEVECRTIGAGWSGERPFGLCSSPWVCRSPAQVRSSYYTYTQGWEADADKWML